MKRALCWIRRDLRLHDHFALSEALKNADETIVAFIFDELILQKLHNKNDPRVTIIMDSLREMEKTLQKNGSSLIIRFGDPVIEIPKLVEELEIDGLFFNRDYEPYAKLRDSKIEKCMHSLKKDVYSFKDHVFFEKSEILNGSGEIYKVFTPYKNKWLETFRAHEEFIPDYKCNLKKLSPIKNSKNIIEHDWYQDIFFIPTDSVLKGGSKEALNRLEQFRENISNYKEARDVPALEQTSNLSSYIRVGNLSIRDMIRLAIEKRNSGYETWLSELIWRDFYQVILDAYPRVEKNSFRAEYDNIS